MSDIRMDDKTVAFISDWEKRTDKQQRKNTVLFIVIFTMAFLLSMASLFVLRRANYNRIVDQNMKYVQDSAIQEADQIEQEMQHAELSVINLATRYTTLMDYHVGETLEERLKILIDKSIFDRIAYIDPDGKDTSLEGIADVSDRDYFKKAMNGESGWQMLDQSRVTGKPCVIFYSPIVSGEDTIGVMVGVFEQERLGDLFSYQLFNYTPNSYLLQGDGSVVASSTDEPVTENLLERLSHKKFIGETDYAKIQETLKSSERITVTFSFVENRETYVGVIVQFQESDWMVLSELPNDITAGMVSDANKAGRRSLLFVLVVFVLTVLVLMVVLRKQRKAFDKEMELASGNLADALKYDQRQMSIIESLTSIFSSVYYIDMKKEEYVRIKEDEHTVLGIPDSGDANMGFSTYIEKYVSEEYLPKMRDFLDIATICQRVEEGGTLVTEYQRADKGWRRGNLIPAERDENGSVVSIVFGVRKIDSEKEKELNAKEALQEAYKAVQLANAAKTTFLSNMSHDIRTPMNAIVGMTAIAASHLDDPGKVSECLKKITSSSKHLLGLINEVLDMSKIESGKVDLSEEDFSLSELIDNLIAIHQPLIREKNHTLTVRVNNLTHEKVIGDSTRLQQVFTNLLSNAIKYTPNGGRIEVDISEKETNKATVGWFEVIFKDNGIGMSEEYQQTLFEPFSRADDSRVEKIQGTGLGMSIARNIVQMMGGDIAVESQVNKGSVFTVTFVLKLQRDDDIDVGKFVDLPILVVDDEEAACESICEILDSLSMDSEWVTTGREAVEKVAGRHEDEKDYYAVIVDWKMPGMDGLETTREIRRRVGSDVPIIIISAYDWSDIEAEAREAGANEFLSKPLFKSRLVELFSRLQDGKDPAGAENMAAGIKKYDFSGKRILLAEDNELNCEIAAEILKMAGFEVETAQDGKICVDKFADSRPGYYDLILMDVRMPVMDGYEATRTIRSLARPDAKKIPIIAMTANAFSSDVREAMNAGMDGHIAKPMDIDRVMKVLDETFS